MAPSFRFWCFFIIFAALSFIAAPASFSDSHTLPEPPPIENIEKPVCDSNNCDPNVCGSCDETDPEDTDQDDTDQDDTDQDDTDPGGTNPGEINPGSTNPGSTNPGGTNPGSTNPGGTTPDITNPGDTNQENSFIDEPSKGNIYELKNPLKYTSLKKILLALVNGITIVLMPVIVLVIAYIGFRMVWAGREKNTDYTRWKQAFGWALIGLFLVLGARGILYVIQNTVKDVLGPETVKDYIGEI